MLLYPLYECAYIMAEDQDYALVLAMRCIEQYMSFYLVLLFLNFVEVPSTYTLEH